MYIKAFRNENHGLMFVIIMGDGFAQIMSIADAYKFLRPFYKGVVLQTMHDAVPHNCR